MRPYRIAIAPAAVETVRNLQPEIKRSIRNALEALARDPSIGVELRGELAGLSRYRMRRYRIIYAVDRTARALRVLAVGHRKTVYEDVADQRRGARLSGQRKPTRR